MKLMDVSRALRPVFFTDVSVEDAFWKPKLQVNQTVTLNQCLDKCEETGRISNFAKAAGRMPGEFEGIYFNDSDVYKVLEGVAYSLMNHPNPELESRADGIIELIVAAQQSDGYLNTYYTLTGLDQRWTDMEKHEDYCAGHMIEAAVAYHRATGKRAFLDVAIRLADHVGTVFGPGKRHWVIGHEELELALVKLFVVTGEQRYLRLADWFLQERGHGHGRGRIWDIAEWGAKYCQDDKPVKEMTDIAGHAVRAMYLYAGMADVAAHTGDREYLQALERLWESTVLRNMYFTGGIGSTKDNEGFTRDYDLPNETAYCETCASVGMALWNHRMNLLTGDGKYADVVERVLYNGVLSGVSLDGARFFYDNPLLSRGGVHRRSWFDCSCCPTQIARFLPSLGGYVYATRGDEAIVNLYLAGSGRLNVGGGAVTLRQRTDYPWQGTVELTVEAGGEHLGALRLRQPQWCKAARVQVNGEPADVSLQDGYLRLKGPFHNGDRVTLELDMPVVRNHADPRVEADAGRTAISRGPVVYCFEQCDNGADVLDAKLDPRAALTAEHLQDLLGGVTVIAAANPDGRALTAVPYFAWDNREPGGMQVWIEEG